MTDSANVANRSSRPWKHEGAREKGGGEGRHLAKAEPVPERILKNFVMRPEQVAIRVPLVLRPDAIFLCCFKHRDDRSGTRLTE